MFFWEVFSFANKLVAHLTNCPWAQFNSFFPAIFQTCDSIDPIYAFISFLMCAQDEHSINFKSCFLNFVCWCWSTEKKFTTTTSIYLCFVWFFFVLVSSVKLVTIWILLKSIFDSFLTTRVNTCNVCDFR